MNDTEAKRALAQVIHDSFWATQAGEDPKPGESGEFNSGDAQLAYDILRRYPAWLPNSSDSILEIREVLADVIGGGMVAADSLDEVSDELIDAMRDYVCDFILAEFEVKRR